MVKLTIGNSPAAGDSRLISDSTGRDAFNAAGLFFPTFLSVLSFGNISDGSRPAPEISISGDTSPVTEGTAASFTVTATPAQRTSQSVNLTVSQSGSFVASGDLGSSKTVTIGTSGEATYTVPTVDDSTVEANGSVTVTVNSGTGYTVASAPNNAATVTVDDDEDTTAPGVTSIERQSSTGQYTNADSLTWRVTFSEAVRNVNAADFSLVIAYSPVAFPGTTALAVSSVSTSVYDITATGSGIENADNSIQIVFASGHDIEDLSGNDLPASPSLSSTAGSVFQLDNTAPTVTSIARQMPAMAMTDEDTLTWRVTFSEAGLVNVDATDFRVFGTTATITNVAEYRPDGLDSGVYDVTASGGDLENLNGTVTLSIKNTHDIADASGNALTDTTPTSGTNDNTFEVSNFVADQGAPQVVSIKRHAQEVRNLGTSLVWRVEFDKHLPNVYASDFTLSGTTAGLDVRHDLSNYDPKTYKTVVFVYAQGGDLETVSGTVTLNFANNHNIRDFEGRRLASTTPTSGTNDNTFTLNPNETLIYLAQEEVYVNEGDEAVLTVKLSRLRDTATTINLSATPLTATGNGVDYHGLTHTATIPAYRSSGTVRIRTSDDALTEDEETFRIDPHNFNLPADVSVANVPGSTTNYTYVNIRDEDTATAKAKKEPDLVFDNAHLTWNEADGCDSGTGPTYNVKLKNRPAGPVEVWIKDPDDDNRRGQNAFVANNRLYVENSIFRNNIKESHTKLRFTPGNWDKYQLVNVKVRCSDHYTAQIPIKHRMYTNYIGDKGKLSHAYPGYSGVVDKGWTVHVYIRESDPPIVLKHLPAAGQTVDVKEGSHLDFEITLSESAFKHDSSLTVYLSARGGKAAGVKRRDGRAQSCGGPLDDCLIFTPSNRTQWVRLFAIGPGRDELKVEIPQLLWGNLDHVRDWEMQWPVEVIQAGQAAPAEHVAVPTEAVSNLQVAAIDAASASVTWNAVDHARFYEVSWSAKSSDKQTVISGIESMAGTSTTIWHNAQEDMTLTVTVTPEYVDGNGITQRMEALAATATFDIGPSAQSLGGGTNGGGDGGQVSAGEGDSRDSALAACVSVKLLADVEGYAGETWRTSPGHVERWSRVLAAFGVDNAYSNNPMTVAEAQAQADRGLKRWEPVVPALECLENPPQEETEQAEVQPVTPTIPELSLSAGSAIDEGGNATFTVTADPAPQSDLTIAFTVAQSGEYLAAPGAGGRTATLTAGATSTVLSVGTVDDEANEADGSVSVTLGTGTGYTIATGTGSAAVSVHDNDEPVVSITAGSAVTEGTSASFTVSANPVPTAPLDVTLSLGQSGDFAASGETGSRTVSVPVTGSVDVEVATVDDAADEADGLVTATVDAGTGYTVAPPPDNTTQVAVSDNDAALSGPTLSIADAEIKENQYRGYFTVTLSKPMSRTIEIYYATRESTPVSAVADQDYFAWQRFHRAKIWIPRGKTTAKIPIYIYNDSHDEDPETFEMVLYDVSDGVSIADDVAVGTIVNDDPMPAAWLSRFGRTAAEQALDSIAGRIAASRSAGIQGAIAGQALILDSESKLSTHDIGSDVARAFDKGSTRLSDDRLGPVAFDPAAVHYPAFSAEDRAPQSYSMTAQELLVGSSFTATEDTDASGGSLAFWGRAAQSSFDGQEGTFSLDGKTTTVMVGTDYARGESLLGMALMYSKGKGGYADTEVKPRPEAQTCPTGEEGQVPCGDAVRAGDGTVEASLTSVIPYGAIQASERFKVWGAFGHGSGEVTLKPEVGSSLNSDIAWTMAAGGLRGDLIAPSTDGNGFALAVTADALWARTTSNKTHELAASDTNITRLGVGLEGSWPMALAGDGNLTPKFELGLRQDGGDAETGFGIELGGGVTWMDPALGMSLDLSGRTLITHDSDELKNRGFGASLAWDPKPATARGPSVRMNWDWGGQATGGLDSLFTAQTLDQRTGTDSTSARWRAEAAYGWPVLGGRFIGSPHLGLGLGTGSREYSLGWRVTPERHAPDLSFGVRATRTESDSVAPEHAVRFEAIFRW